jgi:hypothetical protein
MGMLILQSQSEINLYFFSTATKLHINMEILIKKAQCELPFCCYNKAQNNIILLHFIEDYENNSSHIYFSCLNLLAPKFYI